MLQHPETEHGDAQFPGEDDDGDPPRELTQHRQPDQCRTDQRLVRDRVGQLAEVRDQAPLTGDTTVVVIRHGGEGEHAPRRRAPPRVVAVVDEQDHDEDGDENDAEHRQHIGKVHHGHISADRIRDRVGLRLVHLPP